MCAHTWQIGGIAATKPPDLVTCVLPDREVGVFPNTDCAALGLPEANLRLSQVP